MYDATLAPFTFAATEITVEARTLAARAVFAELFGVGAISATLPKSEGERFIAFLRGRGLAV